MAIEDYIDAKKGAQLMGITVSSFHELCKRQTLPYSWVAGRKVVKRAAIQRLMDDPEYQKRSRRRVA